MRDISEQVATEVATQDCTETLPNGLVTINKDVKENLFQVTRSKWSITRNTQRPHKEQQPVQMVSLDEARSRHAKQRMDVNVVHPGSGGALRQTPQMHENTTDLEGRLRKHNIWVFGLPEDMEGISPLKCLEKLIKTNISVVVHF